MPHPADSIYGERFWPGDVAPANDRKKEFQRDRARLMHSSGFRRMQGKTQVMGVGEGDFHRTRLTHSLEVSQIGLALRQQLGFKREGGIGRLWLPPRDLVLASCLAHDLGHPPFGHGGERALHRRMIDTGGFEGNGQTLRILTRLEKYREGQGINPTRRLILGVLKYPVPYSAFAKADYLDEPPKCYFDEEAPIVRWAWAPFPASDQRALLARGADDKPLHRTLDASIMECADDIAYGVHDLEDIVARKMVTRKELGEKLHDANLLQGTEFSLESFLGSLFDTGSASRKRFIERLGESMVESVNWKQVEEFEHPLLRYRAVIPSPQRELLSFLKKATYELVVLRASVQQLERRGERIVEALFEELASAPESLIPAEAWAALPPTDTIARRVCDYISGMTDPYAEKVYRRLFTPGFGSSRDEL